MLSFVCLAVLFSTVRRANGFAALHDLVTGTRVVFRPKSIESRESLRRQPAPASLHGAGSTRIGPYIVPEAVATEASAVREPIVVSGYDDRLRRAVWIELLPPGVPPLPAWRRDLGRPGRARWLSGRRSDTDSWDAYEAMDGQPLLDAVATAQPGRGCGTGLPISRTRSRRREGRIAAGVDAGASGSPPTIARGCGLASSSPPSPAAPTWLRGLRPSRVGERTTFLYGTRPAR